MNTSRFLKLILPALCAAYLPCRCIAQCQSCEILQELVKNVSVRNGNFFIGYTDLEYGFGQHKLYIERVYNSKSGYSGLFGLGWGSDFGDYGEAFPDGSFTFYSGGAGSLIHFSPMSFDVAQKARAIDLVYKALQLDAGNPESSINLKQKLSDDYEFFLSSWSSLIRRKKIRPFVVADGTKFTSTTYIGYMTLEKVKTGYRLYSVSNGTTSLFNTNGILYRKIYDDGAILNLKLDSLNRTTRVSNNKNTDVLQLYYTGKNITLDSARVVSGNRVKYRCAFKYK